MMQKIFANTSTLSNHIIVRTVNNLIACFKLN